MKTITQADTSVIRSSLSKYSGVLIEKSRQPNDGMLISQNLRVSLFGNLVTSDKQLSNRIFFALQITDQDRTYTYLSGKYSFDEPVYAVQEKFRNGEYGDLVANLVHDAEENPERFFVA